MKAIIITIGDEILLGQILDTNSRFMADQLARIGVDTLRIESISDQAGVIVEALRRATDEAEVVLITGGLGPTKDDVTKKTLADYFHTPLVFNPAVYERVAEFLSHYPRAHMNEYNKSQAYLPEKCVILPNPKGTASGMWFEQDEKIVVSIPGVPFEAEYLMEQEIIPRLTARLGADLVKYRMWTVLQVPEAELALHLRPFEEMLPVGVGLAYLPSPGCVRLRLTAKGENAAQQVEEFGAQLEKSLQGYTVVSGQTPVAEVLVQTLAKAGVTIACAESCTGGNIARLITSQPGASAYFLGGVVAYSNELKHKALGVNKQDLAQYGAVSEPVAVQMAQGIRRLTGAEWAVSTTGIAGPTGGSKEKPVGTVWIALAGPRGTQAKEFHFSATRERNIAKASLQALQWLVESIQEGIKKGPSQFLVQNDKQATFGKKWATRWKQYWHQLFFTREHNHLQTGEDSFEETKFVEEIQRLSNLAKVCQDKTIL